MGDTMPHHIDTIILVNGEATFFFLYFSLRTLYLEFNTLKVTNSHLFLKRVRLLNNICHSFNKKRNRNDIFTLVALISYEFIYMRENDI